MNLDRLLPPAVLATPEEAAAAIPAAALLRVNFVPGLRQRLGWRGMRQCTRDPGSLTARVAGMAGVFGLAPLGPATEIGSGRAEFALAYFPAPDEERIEGCPVAAGLIALGDDYLERIRDFPAEPGLRELFDIARLRCAFVPGGGLALSLEALDREVTVAVDGIEIGTMADGPRQVVAPGGFDKDLRAFDCALPFVEALAASISSAVGSAPTRLEQHSGRGWRQLFDAAGDALMEPWDAAQSLRLSIGWGAAPPMPPPGTEHRVDVRWRAPQPKPSPYADAAWWRDDAPDAMFSVDKSALGVQDKPKLIVLTGFLGAGKTSFLSRFIEYQAARNGFVAVVQNEIGAKGLDGRLLGQHYAVTEVDEGCVCCTLAGTLKAALGDILRSYQPDFVVLETSGLANPANLLAEIADLEDRLEFSSITTVLDARLGAQTLERYAVARDQIRLADVILLNKVGGEPESALADLEAAIRRLNPAAAVHRTNHGDIPLAVLYGVNLAARRLHSEAGETCGAEGHGHGDCDCHGSGHHHHDCACHQAPRHTHDDDGLTSRIWVPPGPLDRHAVDDALCRLPPGVLRVKGAVELQGETEPRICQFVPGRFSLSPAGEAGAGDRFLVFIGENIDQAVAEFIHRASGVPAGAEASCADIGPA